MDNRCLNRVMMGSALGATVGGAVGACYGTYEAFAYRVGGGRVPFARRLSHAYATRVVE